MARGSLKDNPRTFAELDSGIQRALGLLIPGFVTLSRQVQVDDSLMRPSTPERQRRTALNQG